LSRTVCSEDSSRFSVNKTHFIYSEKQHKKKMRFILPALHIGSAQPLPQPINQWQLFPNLA
jgi:hypothetical protein